MAGKDSVPISQQELKNRIIYDPDTGSVVWRITFGSVKAGYRSKSLNTSGYLQVMILGRSYSHHRLAFLYMTGSFPTEEVDHINGIRTDNRWVNLRAVARLENRKNVRMLDSNTSGHVGVRWLKDRKKWRAYIKSDRKQKMLGYFNHLSDALAARALAERELGFHKNHGRTGL